MQFIKYDDISKVKPEELVSGNVVQIRKNVAGGFRWELHKVAADGSLYPMGITEEEWLRMDRLDNDQIAKVESLTVDNISKLDGLDNQETIDEKIEDAKAQASGSNIAIIGTALPRGTDVELAEGTTKGWGTLTGGTGGTTYTNTGRPAPDNQFVIDEGTARYAYYDKTADQWTLGNVIPMPDNSARAVEWTAGLSSKGSLRTVGDQLYLALRNTSEQPSETANDWLNITTNPDLANVLNNTKKISESIGWFGTASFWNLSGETQNYTNTRRTTKIVMKEGDYIDYGLNTAAVIGSSIANVVLFDSSGVFQSVVVKAGDHINQFLEGRFKASEDCQVAFSDGNVELGTGYVKLTSLKENSLYIDPAKIDKPSETDGVSSAALAAKINGNITFDTSYDVGYHRFSKRIENKVVSPTNASFSDDESTDIYMLSAKQGDVITYKSAAWKMSETTLPTTGVILYVVVSESGSIVTFGRHNQETDIASGSYTVTQDCTFYLFDKKRTIKGVIRDTDVILYAKRVDETSVEVKSKLEEKRFANFLDGDVTTSDDLPQVHDILFFSRMISSSQTGYFTPTTISSGDGYKYNVVLRYFQLVSGNTYTLNWVVAEPFAIYAPIVISGSLVYEKLSYTIDEEEGTTTFTVPDRITRARIVRYGIRIDVSHSDNQVVFDTWQHYKMFGFGYTTEPIEEKLSAKAFGFGGVQNCSINLYDRISAAGLTNDGTDDISSVLQPALYEIGNTGGKLYVPKGEYIANDIIIPSNVTIEGEDMYQAKFFGTLQNPVFKTVGTIYFRRDASSHNIHCKNFTVDGGMVETPVYVVDYKAFYLLLMEDSTFENLQVLNTVATGFGCDFFKTMTIRNITARNCGRLVVDENSPGGSGIGIGTGSYDLSNPHSEATILTGLHAYNCGQYGIFLEHQHTNRPTIGYRITDSFAEGCRVGFGLSGAHGTVIANCQSYANKEAGFAIDSGSFQASTAANRVARKSIIANCVSAYNGKENVDINSNEYLMGNGFVVKGQQNAQGFMFTGCSSFNNKADGFIAVNQNGANNYINELSIEGGNYQQNGRHGVHLLNNTMSKLKINPYLLNENDRNGVHINANVNKAILKDSIITDNAGNGVELVSGKTFDGIYKDCIVNDNGGSNEVNISQG